MPFVVLIFFIAGIFTGTCFNNFYEKEIHTTLCKQLYTQTNNYAECVSENIPLKYIKKVRPIDEK